MKKLSYHAIRAICVLLKINISIGILLIGLTGCKSSTLVENWKNPETDIFDAHKVLVVGMTSKIEIGKAFENMLVSELRKNGIEAVQSLNFFEKSFASLPKTEAELLVVETQLLKHNFDAILISKVLGGEEKINVISTLGYLDKSFRDDYFDNQHLYQAQEHLEKYYVFHAESTLYCIFMDRNRQLLWKGAIDIIETANTNRAIADYVKVIILALKEQNLLITKKDIRGLIRDN